MPWLGVSAHHCCQLNLRKLALQTLLRMPEVIRLLHTQPKRWSVASELSKPQGHFRRDRVGTGQDPMQLLTRNPKPSRRLTDRQPKRWQHLFAHKLTRMDRGTFHRAFYNIFSHQFPSMILFKIDTQRITALPLERDVPWAVDVDAVAFGQTMETTKVESWHLQICQ